MHGVDLTVYTPSNPEYPAIDESGLSEVNPKVNIIKHPIKEPYSLYKKFTGKKKNEKIYSGFINEKESFTQKTSVWIRGNIFIPDARKWWIKPSIKHLTKIIKHQSFDAIISTGPPHSMHLIALGIKEKHPAIKWIADFRDPWTNIDFYQQLKLTKWGDRKHKSLELKVLRTADRVVTVSNSWAEDFKKLGGIKKVSVIHNGYDHQDFEQSVNLKPQFNISHLGAINKDRNPTVLWKALKEIQKANLDLFKKIRVDLIGNTDHEVKREIDYYNLNESVELRDFIPHKEAISEMMSSHVLLLLINDTPNSQGILPGKLFEYLGSGRPILCIGPKTGDIKTLMDEYKHTYYIGYEEVDKCKESIIKLVSEVYKTADIDTNRFTRKELAKKYALLIENLILEK